MRNVLLLIAALGFLAMWSYALIDKSLAWGKDDIAIDLIEACIEAGLGAGECTMQYTVKNLHATISIGGKQVFCRTSNADQDC